MNIFSIINSIFWMIIIGIIIWWNITYREQPIPDDWAKLVTVCSFAFVFTYFLVLGVVVSFRQLGATFNEVGAL